MHILKQSTAATVLVGPVMDSTGAIYTGAVIGDFTLTKNGTPAAMAAAATATHDHNGHYLIALTTGNTDTLGRAAITCNKSTYAMPPSRFSVLAAATFDALITNAANTTGGLPILSSSSTLAYTVSTVTTLTNAPTISAINGLAPPTNWNLISVDASGRLLLQPAQTGVTIPTVTTTGTATTLTNLPAVPTDWLTAAGVKADAVTKIQAGLSTYAGGAVASVTAPVTAGTVTDKTGYALTQAFPANFAATSISVGGKVAATVASGDDADAASVKTTIGVAGAGLSSIPYTGPAALTDYQQRGVAVTLPVAGVPLAASQPNYAPAKAGDAMTLTGAYDAAKTAAQATTALSTAVWTATRAGYVDNLSAGAVALATQIPPNFTTATFASAGVFSVGALANAPTGGSAPSAGTVAAAVWDLATSSHTTSGTFGAAAVAAGSAGDPWSVDLPGSYGAGTAGAIVGANLNATVSSRSTYSGGAVASVSGSVGSVVAPVTAGTVTDKTGYALASAPPTAEAVSAQVASDLAAAHGSGSWGAADVSGLVTALASVKSDTATVLAQTGTTGVVVSAGSKAGYSLNLSQTGYSPRALDAVSDAALTTGDLLVAAACGAVGKQTVIGTGYAVTTPFTGTSVRTFLLDSASAPSRRS